MIVDIIGTIIEKIKLVGICAIDTETNDLIDKTLKGISLAWKEGEEIKGIFCPAHLEWKGRIQEILEDEKIVKVF